VWPMRPSCPAIGQSSIEILEHADANTTIATRSSSTRSCIVSTASTVPCRTHRGRCVMTSGHKFRVVGSWSPLLPASGSLHGAWRNRKPIGRRDLERSGGAEFGVEITRIRPRWSSTAPATIRAGQAGDQGRGWRCCSKHTRQWTARATRTDLSAAELLRLVFRSLAAAGRVAALPRSAKDLENKPYVKFRQRQVVGLHEQVPQFWCSRAGSAIAP